MVKQPKSKLPEKSVNEMIEEIHEAFYTEVDRLLESAKVSRPIEMNNPELLERAQRLEFLGFKSAKGVKEANEEMERILKIEQENKDKKELIEAINHFSFKYPNYKFITEDSVKMLCQKYNLIYSPVDKYIGDVPEKNLRHIEDFQISEDDVCHQKEVISTLGNYSSILFLSRKERFAIEREYKMFSGHGMKEELGQSPLEIVAPRDKFDLSGMEVKDRSLSKKIIPDPIVLQPVIFKNKKHYLVVTAWGKEASDNLVVNERNN